MRVSPGIVTAFNGSCELSLDQRALDAAVLAEMLATAQESAARIAAEEGCEVAWEQVWEIEPIPFDTDADRASPTRRSARSPSSSHRLPSGPLHDAAEMARVMPTVMLFVKSLGGVSHTKEEDTPDRGPGAVRPRARRAHAADARLGAGRPEHDQHRRVAR